MTEAPMKHNHSRKTFETITLMGTTPEQWGIVPYTVRDEVRDLSLPVECSECHGRGVIYSSLRNIKTNEIRAQHAVWSMLEEQVKAEHSHISDYSIRDAFFKGEFHCEGDDSSKWFRDEPLFTQYGWEMHSERGSMRCPICPAKQSRRGYWQGTGKVFQFFENVPVNAHYPSWPKDVMFNSRFPRGHDGCEACGKTGIKSGTYAVAAKGDDGMWRGMFVGNSCLKKFGLKQFKSVDEQAKKWDIRKAHGNDGLWQVKSENGRGSEPMNGKRVLDLFIHTRKDIGALEDVSEPVEEVVEEVDEEVKTVKPIEVKDIEMVGEKGVGKSISISVKKTFDCPHCGKQYGSRQGRYNHLRKGCPQQS